MQLLAVGRSEEAARTLNDAATLYKNILLPGINLTDLCFLRSTMAALKVLVDALMQTGDSSNILNAALLQADVEETEAILAGYREGVLEETRGELREQQRARGPGAAGAAGAGEGGAEAKKRRRRRVRPPSGSSRNAKHNSRRGLPRWQKLQRLQR